MLKRWSKHREFRLTSSLSFVTFSRAMNFASLKKIIDFFGMFVLYDKATFILLFNH